MRAFLVTAVVAGVAVAIVSGYAIVGAEDAAPPARKPAPDPKPAVPPPPKPGAAATGAAGHHVPGEAAAPQADFGAIGDLAGVSVALRRALTEPGVFRPVPTPGPSDWLANHEEEGQTFEEFRVGPRRPVTRERKTIQLVALDNLAAGNGPTLEVLVDGVAAFYGLPVVVHKPTAIPKFPTRAGPLGTPQFLTTDVMTWLKSELGSDTYCLVALTQTDLYPDPAWNFVFGMGSFTERVGVFSFARYDLDALGKDAPADAVKERRALLLRRSMKVLTHELGHLFGMEHCIEHACLMNGCNHLREMDGQPFHLCPVCLRKVLHTTKRDVATRYAEAEAFYRREGLVAEADWYRARHAYVVAEK